MVDSTRVFQSGAFRIIIALGFVLAAVGGGVQTTVAQDAGDTSYVLETTGDEVTWDAPWEIQPDITDIGDGFEIIGFASDTASLLISVIPNDLDLEEARDATLEAVSGEADSYTIVDRGAYENISYALDIAAYDDAELGVFTLFRGGSGDTPTFVYVFIGGIPSFSEGFASAQETFRVSGDTIFNGVEGQGLEDLLVQNSGGGGETPATEEATEEATREPDDRPTEEPQDDPTEESTNEPIDDEFLDLGVVEQGVYESPQFGTEVLWSEDWTISEGVDEPIVSDESNNLDLINLTDENNTIFSIQMQSGAGVTPDALVELWTSAEFLNDIDTEGTEPDEIVLSDSGRDIGSVVQRADLEDGTELVIVREVQILDGGETVAIVQFVQTVGAFESSLASAQEGIELDGEPVLSLFDVEDIAAEFE